jgi:hypothetical protein
VKLSVREHPWFVRVLQGYVSTIHRLNKGKFGQKVFTSIEFSSTLAQNFLSHITIVFSVLIGTT